MSGALKKFWVSNKNMLLFCIIVTFVWGFVAHGYAFANFQLSHDALDGLYSEGNGRENAHKIELGRVMVPAYRYLFRGLFAMPWLTGLMGLLWIALAVWITVAIFRVQSKLFVVMCSGLMTVNIAIIALTGTFLHDFDQNMFGMMLACLFVLLWQRRTKGWVITGAVAAAVCLSIYPAFISMAIGLIMMVLLLSLLDGQKPSQVVRRGIEGAAVMALGGILFLLLVWGVTTISGVPLASRENSISALESLNLASLPQLVCGMYSNWWNYFVAMPNTWLTSRAASVINGMLLILVAIMLFTEIFVCKGRSVCQKVLAILIVLLLPLGMNVSYLLSSGFIHHLMQYAFILFYVLCLLLVGRLWEHKSLLHIGKTAGWCCLALIALILWSGVQTANTYHFKKNIATKATDARMTAVYHDMLVEGYVPGKTPLVIDGRVYIASPEGFEDVSLVYSGAAHNAITHDPKSIRAYFKYVLGDDAMFCSEEQWDEIVNDPYVVYEMPCYPEYGYIDYVGDVMIVNLS